MKKNVLLLNAVFICLFFSASVRSEEIKAPEKITYKTQSDILYRDANEAKSDEYIMNRCRLDIYYPSNKTNFATVVWFHGGGLQGGEKYIPEELKEQGIAVIAVNYRLYPKVLCPVYIDDAAAAVAWTFKNINKYGGDPNIIFISGGSAGGYLAGMVGLDKKYLAKYGIDANKIASIIPFSGHMITHFAIRQEKGIPSTQPVIDEFAPLYHVRSDAPPLILITGDRNIEMLGRYEENAYMMRMMNVVGHKKTELYEIQGHDHTQMNKPANTILLDYIKKYCK